MPAMDPRIYAKVQTFRKDTHIQHPILELYSIKKEKKTKSNYVTNTYEHKEYFIRAIDFVFVVTIPKITPTNRAKLRKTQCTCIDIQKTNRLD